MAFKKSIEWLFFITISTLLLFRGMWNGFGTVSYSLNLFSVAIDVILLDAISSNILFTLFMLLGGGLLFREVNSRKKSKELVSGPLIEAIVPVYNDAEVLSNSVDSLNDSGYQDLRINVVCEEEDEESIEAAEKLDCELIINDYPGSKAGAINTVFERRDSEYFAIFDADELVHKDFLPKAMGYLEEGYQGFQGRRVPIPSGLIEKFAYCERALFHTAYKISEFSGFRNLRSSSTVMKREVWETVGGYEDLLTEDLDFPHKCYRHGIRIKQDRRCTNLMEAPHSTKDFWGQRKRWSMGQIQILHKALKGGYSKNFTVRGMVSNFRIVMGILVPLLMLGLLSKFIILTLLGLETFYLMPVIATSLLALILSFKDIKRHPIKFIGLYSILTNLAVPITALLNIKSFFEYIISWNGDWYEVDKKGE
ncbi:MAG: glycosyltransferase [Candidatus Nanohaloarchaea archaeon]